MNSTFLSWFKQHVSEYQAVLFDIDGTVTLGPNPLPGNKETIDYLRSIHFPFFFLTNDGISTHERKVQQLAKGGVTGHEDEIVSSSDALVGYVSANGLQGQKALLLGAPGGQTDYMRAAKLLPMDISHIDECQLLFIGEGKFDWFHDIQRTINFLRLHPDIPIVVANPDSVWAGMPDGSLGVGAGGIARFIVAIMRDLGITLNITYLGKPNPGIYLATIKRLSERFGIQVDDNRKIIMVGDALFSDICGAKRMGMTAALVMTGLTTAQALANAQGDQKPDLVFDTLGPGN